MEYVLYLIFGAIALFMFLPFIAIAGVMVFFFLNDQKRLKALANQHAAYATAHGLGFRYEEKIGWVRGGPFGKGISAKSKNITWGIQSGWVTATFLYEWDPLVGDPTPGKKGEPWVELVSGVFIGSSIPFMSVYPEIDLTYKPNDLMLESGEFNDAFRVEWEDKAAAVKVLDPRMMEFMLRLPPGTTRRWAIWNGWLYTYRRVDRRWPVERYRELADIDLRYLTDVARQLPKLAVREHGVTYGQGADPNAAIRVLFPNMA